jgi:hypothetical protein
MSAERYLYRQACAVTGSGLYCQHTTNAARPLLYRDWPQSKAVQFIPRKAAGEAKALPIIVHDKNQFTFILPQFYHDVGSMRMFFHIV